MTTSPRPQDSITAAEHLNDAMKRLRARLRTESGQHATGLSATQLGVLASVAREGPITAARLSAVEHVSGQAIAQRLAVLKAAGLVHSEPDPKDGRKKPMSADPSATELIDKLLSGRAAFLAACWAASPSPAWPPPPSARPSADCSSARQAGAGPS
ncbi:helix-turn-helix domain-containing protein [Streptomyces sp. NPDC052164]|uniref:MarR family winged helix-turn-helix transcriptional regulator n=1 Tax=unclassified Streptomyces TaxID=2593676 RepID=UPI00343B698A